MIGERLRKSKERSFQSVGPATLKAPSPKGESLEDATERRWVSVEWSELVEE